MIGLLDIDLQSSTSVKLMPPNLEIMKLAAYYRLEKNTFCHLINLNETEFGGYEKIYCFSEADNPPVLPTALLKAPQLICGGTAFTNREYIPFENSLIDYTLPRTFIYKEYLNTQYNNGIKFKVIEHILDDTYYRRYAGQELLPVPAMKIKKRIFLYDRNFFSNDWEKFILLAQKRKVSSVLSIHPIICKNMDEYLQLRKYPIINRSDNEIFLDLDVPLKEIPYFLKQYKSFLLADINKSALVYLPLGGNYKTNFQFFNNFIYTLNLLYSFWSHQIPIKLKFIPPYIGINNPLFHLSLVVETWSSRKTNGDKSLNDRIVYKNPHKQSVEQMERDLLLKTHVHAKDLFDQNYNDINQRGYWKI